jgi:hypothetical protein
VIQKNTLGDYSSLIADFRERGGVVQVCRTKNLGSKMLRKKSKAERQEEAEAEARAS